MLSMGMFVPPEQKAMPAKEHTVVRKRPENGKRMNNAKNMRKMEESSTAHPSRLFCCCKMCFLCCKGTVSGPGGCLCICPSIQNRNMCDTQTLGFVHPFYGTGQDRT